MDGKQRIRKIAIPTGIVMSTAIILLILLNLFAEWQDRKQADENEKNISALASEIQAEADAISKRIHSLPIDEKLSADLQSEYLLLNQQPNKVKKYLWMIGDDDQLVLAVPSPEFKKLNSIYDTYKKIISNIYYIFDRNDFILKTIEWSDEIGGEDFTRQYSWEFKKFPDLAALPPGMPPPGYYNNPLSVSVSSPVYNEENKWIGTLYLKADGRGDEDRFHSLGGHQHPPLEGFFITLGMITFFSGILLWFLMPSWVYLDARQRDIKYPAVWAFISLLSLGFFGLMVYLITRPSKLKELRCPSCQEELDGANTYCPYCGHDLSTVFCSECRAPVRPGWAFCPHCRASLKNDSEESSDTEKA